MNNLTENATRSAQERRDSDCAAVNACTNCETTRGYLNTIHIDDSAYPVLLCEECASEVRRMEAEADALVALQSSCEARASLIDHAQSTAELVNLLRAHDMGCKVCRVPARKELLAAAGCTDAEAAAFLREVA